MRLYHRKKKQNYIMAKNNQPETRTAIDDINDSLSSIEQKVQNNQKVIMWVSVAVAIVVCLILVYIYGIRKPGIEAANDAVGQADLELALGNDTIALQQYQQVADEYGYEGGNRAALNAAILLYQQGKYQEALNYLDQYSSSESIIGASSKSLEGDCYVNLKQYPEALKAYDKAISAADENPTIVPLLLVKKANIYRAEKNYEAEYEALKEVVEDYPQFDRSAQADIRKMYERAKASAGK